MTRVAQVLLYALTVALFAKTGLVSAQESYLRPYRCSLSANPTNTTGGIMLESLVLQAVPYGNGEPQWLTLSRLPLEPTDRARFQTLPAWARNVSVSLSRVMPGTDNPQEGVMLTMVSGDPQADSAMDRATSATSAGLSVSAYWSGGGAALMVSCRAI